MDTLKPFVMPLWDTDNVTMGDKVLLISAGSRYWPILETCTAVILIIGSDISESVSTNVPTSNSANEIVNMSVTETVVILLVSDTMTILVFSLGGFWVSGGLGEVLWFVEFVVVLWLGSPVVLSSDPPPVVLLSVTEVFP